MSDGGSNQQSRQQSVLLPSDKTAKEFGKIYTRREGNTTHVEFTIWMQDLEGSQAENWQTGVALDASASMKNWYGRNLKGKVPSHALEDYEKRGWVSHNTEDGVRVQRFKKDAYDDAIAQGYLTFTENIVQPLAQDFISYLAQELDEDGGTTVIYWACGDGGLYEVMGDFTEEECRTLEVGGPSGVSFGQGTRLTPAVRYFVERFEDAKRGIYVFITDGKLDDMEELKKYTTQLAQEIEAEKRNFVKCVLIGVGDSIDEDQMEELDDLETGTDVDIWDHKIAAEMRAVTEIIAELVDENRIVAPTATVFDDQDQVVHRFADGLPARAAFELPSSSKHFVLEVGDHRVMQELV